MGWLKSAGMRDSGAGQAPTKGAGLAPTKEQEWHRRDQAGTRIL